MTSFVRDIKEALLDFFKPLFQDPQPPLPHLRKGDEIKEWQKIHHPIKIRSVDEWLKEKEETDPLIFLKDEAIAKKREKLIFDEETSIWRGVLSNCQGVAGVNRALACKQLVEMYEEREAYKKSGYNRALRPTLTAPLPPYYEVAFDEEGHLIPIETLLK